MVPMKPDTVHSASTEDKLCATDLVTDRSLNFWDFPKWIIELVADDGTVGLVEPRRSDLHEPLKQYADLILSKTLLEIADRKPASAA